MEDEKKINEAAEEAKETETKAHLKDLDSSCGQ